MTSEQTRNRKVVSFCLPSVSIDRLKKFAKLLGVSRSVTLEVLLDAVSSSTVAELRPRAQVVALRLRHRSGGWETRRRNGR